MDVSTCIIGRALKRLNWTKKKALAHAQQQSQVLRDNWKARMTRYQTSQLVFLDESADRKTAWSPIGTIGQELI